jgi:hypothetical protein
MDPFKIGLRNLIGITAPGAIVVLALMYGGINAALLFGHLTDSSGHLKDLQWVFLTAVFLLSYLIGSILRLNSADDVDALSCRDLQCRYEAENRLSQADVPQFLELRDEILRSGEYEAHGALGDASLRNSFVRWLWCSEPFPYTSWELVKLKLYHPPALGRFLQPYKGLMASISTLESRKEFFNYCKIVLAGNTESPDAALLEEVQAAEANGRFFAGAYVALHYSAWLIAAMQLWSISYITALGVARADISAGVNLLPILLACAAFVLSRVNIERGMPSDGMPSDGPNGSVAFADTIPQFDEYVRQVSARDSIRRRDRKAWLAVWSLYASGIVLIAASQWPTLLGSGRFPASVSSLITSGSVCFFVLWCIQRASMLIRSRFRLMRIKEVDIVLEAFYIATSPNRGCDPSDITVGAAV